ncbi:MAG: Gp37 family protein [Bacteroidetes bacterium]|nr:Gp37 family protein [Bacteroidota bacterium]
MGSYSRQALVDALVARLAEHMAFAKMAVGAFPDDPKVYEAKYLKHKNGAVLVAYEGTRRTGEEEVQTPRSARLQVVVLARSGSEGAAPFEAVEAIEEQLDDERVVLSDGHAFDLYVEADLFDEEENRVTFHLVRLRADLV